MLLAARLRSVLNSIDLDGTRFEIAPHRRTIKAGKQMKEYNYGRIRVLANRLEEAGIPQEIRDKILAGGEMILGSASPEKKADWMREA